MKFVLGLILTLAICFSIPSTLPTLLVVPFKLVDNLKVALVFPIEGVGKDIGDQIFSSMQKALSAVSQEYWKRQGYDVSLWPKIHITPYYHTFGADSIDFIENLFEKERVNVLVGGLSSFESSEYAQLAQKHGKMFLSLLPKWLEGLSQWKTSVSFASSHGWDAMLAARHLIKERELQPSEILVVIDDLRYAEDLDILKRVHQGISMEQESDASMAVWKLSFLSLGQLDLGLQEYPAETLEKSVSQPESQSNTPEIESVNQELNVQQNSTIKRSLSDLSVQMILSRKRAGIIALRAKDSEKLLKSLKQRGSVMELIGLDHWDHPSIRHNPWRMKLHYVVQYDDHFKWQFDQSVSDHGELYAFEDFSTLELLSYDAILWLASVYSAARTVRVPQLMRVAISGVRSPSLRGDHYLLGQDHFMMRSLRLVSLPTAPAMSSLVHTLSIPADILQQQVWK